MPSAFLYTRMDGQEVRLYFKDEINPEETVVFFAKCPKCKESLFFEKDPYAFDVDCPNCNPNKWKVNL